MIDLIHHYSHTPQVITTDAVSERVVQWPNDAARDVFVHSENTILIRVRVAAAGMASGIRFQYRFDTQADLASGSEIIVAETPIYLPAALTLNKTLELKLPHIKLASGYDFSGMYYDLVSEAASGGFAVDAALVDGPETPVP